MMRLVNGISLRDLHPSDRLPGSLREAITGPARISHGPGGGFEFDRRRAGTPDGIFRICHRLPDHDAPLTAGGLPAFFRLFRTPARHDAFLKNFMGKRLQCG